MSETHSNHMTSSKLPDHLWKNMTGLACEWDVWPSERYWQPVHCKATVMWHIGSVKYFMWFSFFADISLNYTIPIFSTEKND